MDHNSEFKRHMNTSYGDEYTDAVARFQEGFIADMGLDCQPAFRRAVETCSRLINVFKMKSEKRQ